MPHLQLGDLHIEVIRKSVRTLRLSVLVPDGRVRVTAPLRTTDALIRDLVLRKQPWIEKHQTAIRAQAPAPALRYESGEQHYFQGRAYPLRVQEQAGRAQVFLSDDALHVQVPPGATLAQREQLVLRWHRAQLQHLLPLLLAKWEPVVGVKANAWGIKQMQTRWGSCSIRAKRIWLSLVLSKWPLPCLEYVVVHELVHLQERLHNARFWHLVAQAMPEWRAPHQALKKAALEALP